MGPNLNKKRVKRFQELIFDWFATNQRDLPWRRTHDPYAVLVSELMLQQTQVDRVKKHWPGWVDRWPTFEVLAEAPTGEVIRAWAGLGYNRRAVNLQRAARQIIERGGFQQFATVKELVALPGIGSGTAGALMNFVWDIDTPFLEVNLKRIFQRLAFGPEIAVGWADDRKLLAIAQAVLPKGQARVWPHALMDFGALACRPNDPFCQDCPLGQILPASRLNYAKLTMDVRRTQRPKFETTNRYWRGRIIDLVRAHAQLTRQELYRQLPRPAELAPVRFDELISALIRDGLIVATDENVRLPS